MAEVKALAEFIQWKDLQIINESAGEEVDQGQVHYVCAEHPHCPYVELHILIYQPVHLHHKIHDFLAIVLFFLSSLNRLSNRPIFLYKGPTKIYSLTHKLRRGLKMVWS